MMKPFCQKQKRVWRRWSKMLRSGRSPVPPPIRGRRQGGPPSVSTAPLESRGVAGRPGRAPGSGRLLGSPPIRGSPPGGPSPAPPVALLVLRTASFSSFCRFCPWSGRVSLVSPFWLIQPLGPAPRSPCEQGDSAALRTRLLAAALPRRTSSTPARSRSLQQVWRPQGRSHAELRRTV